MSSDNLPHTFMDGVLSTVQVVYLEKYFEVLV